MFSASKEPSCSALTRTQRGATTLVVAILLLIILTVVVVFAANVGVFEQRTATNENRARLAQSAAEAALSLAAEHFKANSRFLAADSVGGWLEPGNERWQPCSEAVPSGQVDPCLAEADPTRRAQMFRYNVGDVTTVAYTDTVPAAADIVAVGGDAGFPVDTSVTALLCRIETSDPTAAPECRVDPEESRLYAVTLVATAAMGGEAAAAEVKQTLATFRTINISANVPLVASGTVEGLGNAEIVASPNAGGFGVPVSIWSPCDVDISEDGTPSADPMCAAAGGGIGSVQSCHVGEYLGTVLLEDMLTTCTANNACGCEKETWLSGHVGADREEGIDILDIDGDAGDLPDVQFFPRSPYDQDHAVDPLDDSLFEWVFSRDVVNRDGSDEDKTTVDTNCGAGLDEDCAEFELAGMATEVLPDCSTLDSESTGIIWVTGACDFSGNTQVGAPDNPVIMIVEDDMTVGAGLIFYGVLFIRSSDNTASLSGNGNPIVFGSLIVEGSVDLQGGISIVYSEEIAEGIEESSSFTRFGRLPGSWLDSATAF